MQTTCTNNLLSLIGKFRMKMHKRMKKSSDMLLHNILLVIPICNERIFPLSIFTCDIQTKNQTEETSTLFPLCRRVYCKRRIRSQIPKGQATNKQTSKSTETHLTERITHCGSWLQWPYCGLAFICKATQRHLVCSARSGSNQPYLQALLTSVCVTLASRSSL